MTRWNPRLVSRAEIFAGAPERDRKGRFTGLYVAGSLAGLSCKTVAVVGSRAPSPDGEACAQRLGEALARAGVCIVSGLALGIDGAAHRGALRAGGLTIGVLGGGHECFFPSRNLELAREMADRGGAVLSPFAPEHPPRPAQFLQRNAIVAELADAVVVVEASERSGAINTAGWAADNSVPVLAFPGDVDRTLAAGCNALIRDGAILVRNAHDVLESLQWNTPEALRLPLGPEIEPAGDDPAGVVLSALRARALDFEALSAATNLAPGALMALLVRLEVEGRLRRREDATYARVQRGC